MHIAALHRKACLAGVDECSPNRAAGGDIKVGIVKHDHWIFASQLEHSWKQTLGGNDRDTLSRGNAAGEHKFGDRSTQQYSSGGTIANHNLKNLVGHPGRVQEGPGRPTSR